MQMTCIWRNIRFRYATMFYYLNEPLEGGGTAFPFADNETYNDVVSISGGVRDGDDDGNDGDGDNDDDDVGGDDDGKDGGDDGDGDDDDNGDGDDDGWR